jgi:prepilin-type processing-associated H-X9-DG protein
VELLVVIAIISILASLLMPALKNARNTAKQMKCLSNLRQVGVALQMLADDNGGWIDPSKFTSPVVPVGYGGQTWASAVVPYLGGKSGFVVPPGDPSAYTQSCPTVKPGGNGPWPYGVNPYFATVGGDNYPLQGARKPVKIYLVSDMCWYIGGDPGNFDGTVVGGVNAGGPRHEGRGLSFFFVDGHARFLIYHPPNKSDWYEIEDIGGGAAIWSIFGFHPYIRF